MMQPNRKRAHPAAQKPSVTLIEKSQIENPKLNEDMEKILNGIISGIKNGPPAQPRRKYQKGPEDTKKLFSTKKQESTSDISNI